MFGTNRATVKEATTAAVRSACVKSKCIERRSAYNVLGTSPQIHEGNKCITLDSKHYCTSMFSGTYELTLADVSPAKKNLAWSELVIKRILHLQ